MLKTDGPFDEDRPLLYLSDEPVKFGYQQHYEGAVIKGVSNQLGQWPSHLLSAFLAACLIISSLAFLIFVSVMTWLPANGTCCEMHDFQIEKSLNVYFLKLENRTWSTREYCYIESAARNHPELNVYMINLLRSGSTEGYKDEIETDRVENKMKIPNDTDSIESTNLREKLVSNNANIRNINITTAAVFNGTELMNLTENLNNSLLETAAKPHLLWNFPGISLEPKMYCNLEHVEKFLCGKSQKDCIPDKLATVEPKNDIQATNVPCQAFIGFLIRELARAPSSNQYNLTETLIKFCSRSRDCPEVRILDLQSECSPYTLNCPTVYAKEISKNDLNL